MILIYVVGSQELRNVFVRWSSVAQLPAPAAGPCPGRPGAHVISASGEHDAGVAPLRTAALNAARRVART